MIDLRRFSFDSEYLENPVKNVDINVEDLVRSVSVEVHHTMIFVDLSDDAEKTGVASDVVFDKTFWIHAAHPVHMSFEFGGCVWVGGWVEYRFHWNGVDG